MKLVGIVGTDAKLSYNRLLLQYMQKHFADKADIDVCEIKGTPMFNENHPDHDPEQITELANKIKNADGVIIGCPEHNHSVTSALKSTLEWLSYRIHPLTNKPVMIVGASIHPQGSSRAQIHLRQILDSPGVNALVLPGNEFLMGTAQNAFDGANNIKDAKTIKFLSICFNKFIQFITDYQTIGAKSAKNNAVQPAAAKTAVQPQTKATTTKQNIRWDANYDVIVLGFGGAGATAARFAADDGAKVLLVDAAPAGHEGGNTRYSAQMIGTGTDFDSEKNYYEALTHPMDLDEDMVDTFVEGEVNMPKYVHNYLGVKAPVSIMQNVDAISKSKGIPAPVIKANTQEYPEYPGANKHDITLVHGGMFDSALWKILRQQVMDRSDKIDVWLSSPAEHLIQDPETKTILGVQIQRENVLRNIHANNGVVLATGGFENNQKMVQDYLGAQHLAPLGTLFNKGAGVRMGEEVGADMWHMKNYEALGILHGMAFKVPNGQRAKLIVAWPTLSQGSIITVGDDGSRYFREDEPNRHGHIYDHGAWRVPQTNVHPYLIFDQAKYDEFKQLKDLPYKEFFDNLIKADSLADLAKLTHLDPDILQTTVSDYDNFAKNGKDYAYNRDPKTMRAFGDGPFYASPLTHVVLNTQGGPRRNSRTEVLDTKQQPIPHLYSAGELGGLNTNEYQAGGNLAECLIFGKIAGQNAAVPKENAATIAVAAKPQPTKSMNTSNDLKAASAVDVQLGKNQYLGKSNAGMGDGVVVKVTTDDNKNIKNVEIVKQNESGDVAGDALKELPKEMVKQNTYDVDAVSGASQSSKAIKDAVKDALDKAK